MDVEQLPRTLANRWIPPISTRIKQQGGRLRTLYQRRARLSFCWESARALFIASLYTGFIGATYIIKNPAQQNTLSIPESIGSIHKIAAVATTLFSLMISLYFWRTMHDRREDQVLRDQCVTIQNHLISLQITNQRERFLWRRKKRGRTHGPSQSMFQLKRFKRCKRPPPFYPLTHHEQEKTALRPMLQRGKIFLQI